MDAFTSLKQFKSTGARDHASVHKRSLNHLAKNFELLEPSKNDKYVNDRVSS